MIEYSRMKPLTACVALWALLACHTSIAGTPTAKALYKDLERGQCEPSLQTLDKQAEAGNPEHQAALGEAYYFGNCVEKSLSRAIRWYESAAAQGDANAQYSLGWLHEYGKGVRQDDKVAAQYYLKSASQNVGAAQERLGTLYATGRGVAKDPALAESWYRKAALNGDKDAQAWLAGQVKAPKAEDQVYRLASTKYTDYGSEFRQFWRIDDNWQVAVQVRCQGETYGFWTWPDSGCSSLLRIVHQNAEVQSELDTNAILRGIDERPKLTLDGKEISDAIEQVFKGDARALRAGTFAVELQDTERVTGFISSHHSRVDLHRMKLVGAGLAAILALGGGAVYLRNRFLGDVSRKLKEGIYAAKAGANALVTKRQMAVVRRTVLDETIRQTTRSALMQASEEERQALRDQIKSALDSGNLDLVKTLMGILEKFEASERISTASTNKA